MTIICHKRRLSCTIQRSLSFILISIFISNISLAHNSTDEDFKKWKILYDKGKLADALPYLEKLISEIPEDYDYQQWKEFYAAEKYQEAIQHLEKVMAEIPEDYDYQQWKEFYAAGKYQEAIQHLEKVMAEVPEIEIEKWVRKEMPSLAMRIEKYRHLAEREKLITFIAEEALRYDDNLFRKSAKKRATFLSASTVGVDFEFGPKYYKIKGRYRTNYYNYFNAKDQNRFDHYIDLDFGFDDFLNVSRIIGKKIKLTISDVFHPGTYRPSTEDLQYRSLLNNELFAKLDYPITPKTSFAAQYYNFQQYNFDSIYKEFNYNINSYRGGLYYKMTPKTSIFTLYNFDTINYKGKGDYDSFSHRVHGGIEGELTEKSTVSFSAGGEYRDYYDNENVKDRYLFSAKGSLLTRLTPKTSFILYLTRQLAESISFNNPYYINTQFGAGVDQKFGKLSFYGKMGLLFSDYPNDILQSGEMRKRRDVYYKPNVGAVYNMNKWLSFYVDYVYEFRDSNFDDFQYVNNIIETKIQSKF